MNEFIDIESAIAAASDWLRSASESPRLDAEVLLARSLDVNRSYLIAHPEDRMDAASSERFFTAIARRATGEPLAYITGEREFWSMNLMVSPATLVPRPETELLVERALTYIGRKSSKRILDLGTGSGAIALALARERPLSNVVAIDISPDALAIARQNARQLDIANIAFLCGDWLDPVSGQIFDLVVANPPYVRAGDAALEKLCHEPLAALVSGPDGLDAIRRIAATAGAVLAVHGRLLLEHGSEQRQAVTQLLQQHGWSDIECVNDYAGMPRVTVATRKRAA